MKPLAALLILLLALPASAADAPFTWTLKTARTTHYFVGSVHLLPEQAQPLPPALTRALENSRTLVFESDIAAMGDASAQAKMLPAAQSARGIQAEISAAQHSRLRKRLAAMGLPEMLCDNFRAWFCSMTLEVMQYVQHGFRPDLGIDQQLYRSAVAQGKTVRWFEPLDEHLGQFTSMSAIMSAEFLAATLDDLDEGDSSPQQLLRLWQENDLAAINDMLREMKSKHPLVYERLLAGRNRRWMPALVQMLRSEEPQLVVVGAAHYAGPDGLLALLKARGLELRPVAD